MIHFNFNPDDLRFLFLTYDNVKDKTNLGLLKKHLNLVDPICYLPTWGNRPKQTRDFLFEYVRKEDSKHIFYCSFGLWNEVRTFFITHNIEFDGLLDKPELFKTTLKHTFDEFQDIVQSWGLKYQPRPYQLEAAYKVLGYRRSLSELPTRAGKTLISYIIFRYGMEYLGIKKILMIVPSISLVKQGFADFAEYGEFFNTECVWAGGKLVESSNLTIGTFQSLIGYLDPKSKKYNPQFFNDYDCIFVDETHRATAEQTKTIISQDFVKNVKLFFGMSGTLPKPKTIEWYCLQSIIGCKIQSIEPRELMDAGFVSDIEINQVVLDYQDTRRVKELYLKCAEYTCSSFDTDQDGNKIPLPEPYNQIMFRKSLPVGLAQVREKYLTKQIPINDYISLIKGYIKDNAGTNNLVVEKYLTHFLDERINYLITDILPNCKYNTLVLAHHTEYIGRLYSILKEQFKDRHVFMITGATKSKEREAIKQSLKEHNDCILVASYGTLSTGITLSNLCFGVLMESFKSPVVNMQSLGRGLGLSKLKDKYIVYDIIDKFPKELSNAIYLQGKQKRKLYDEYRYPYNTTVVKL